MLTIHNPPAIEIGIGASQAQDHGNGTWYQDGFPHILKLRSLASEIGVGGDASPHFRWHLDFDDLGHFSSDAWATPDDANYSGSTATHCNGRCLPLAHYTGEGGVYGFSATMEAHTKHFGIEAGPFIYRSEWRLDVPNYYQCGQTNAGVFFTGGSAPIHYDSSGWAASAVVGVTFRAGDWGLQLRHYAVQQTGADLPGVWKNIDTLMITYTFHGDSI